MKIPRKMLWASLTAMLFVLALSLPAGAFYFSYTSGFQVQNLSGSTATILITYYNPDGSTATTAGDTIAASGSKTYYPIHPSSPFNGSIVVSSDQPMAAVSNILGDGGAAAASYIGSTSGSTSVSLPLLMKNNGGYNTWYNVQNAGSSSASVTINYSDGTSNSGTIAAGAALTFDQTSETHSSAIFSGSISSDQPVVVAVIEENPSIMFAYNGFKGGATDPVMPLINANNSGYITGVQIQNVGSSSTDVTVSYTPSVVGTACTETQTIPADESKTFALYAFAGSPPSGTTTDCIGGVTFIGSAQVTGNTGSQELVAIVNQLSGSNGEAYGSFDPASATGTVVMPLIMDRNGGYFTGFNLQNVGTSSTSVSCTFTGSSYTVSDTLAAGEALTDLQLGKIADSYVGSATCTAGTGGQIVAVVNELGSGGTDQFLVYEGINVP